MRYTTIIIACMLLFAMDAKSQRYLDLNSDNSVDTVFYITTGGVKIPQEIHWGVTGRVYSDSSTRERVSQCRRSKTILLWPDIKYLRVSEMVAFDSAKNVARYMLSIVTKKSAWNVSPNKLKYQELKSRLGRHSNDTAKIREADTTILIVLDRAANLACEDTVRMNDIQNNKLDFSFNEEIEQTQVMSSGIRVSSFSRATKEKTQVSKNLGKQEAEAERYYIKVFPNPAPTQSGLSINYSMPSGAAQLELVDLLGRICFTTTLHSNGTSMKQQVPNILMNVQPGAYSVRLRSGSEVIATTQFMVVQQ